MEKKDVYQNCGHLIIDADLQTFFSGRYFFLLDPLRKPELTILLYILIDVKSHKSRFHISNHNTCPQNYSYSYNQLITNKWLQLKSYSPAITAIMAKLNIQR